MVYLTTLSVVQATEHVMNELGRYGRNQSWPAVSYRPDICLEGQTKRTVNPVRKTGIRAEISSRDLQVRKKNATHETARCDSVLFRICSRQHSPPCGNLPH